VCQAAGNVTADSRSNTRLICVNAKCSIYVRLSCKDAPNVSGSTRGDSMMRRTLVSLMIAALVVASGGALAQGRGSGGAGHGGGGGGWHGGGGGWHGGGGGWHGGGWHGGGWHGSVGVYFGPYWGWGWPYYYGYPYPYYPYPYDYGYYSYDPYPAYVPSAPLTYEERAPEPSSNSYWYYCTDPAGYYPYVRSCSKPWMQVLPQNVPPASSAPAPSAPAGGPK